MRRWLVDIRNNLNLTQDEVAEKSGIARSTYSMIETGKRNATVTNAKKIAKALNFNWTIFFEDSSHSTCNERGNTA